MVGSYLSYFAFAEVNLWHCAIFRVPQFGFSMVIFWIVTTHSYSSMGGTFCFCPCNHFFQRRYSRTNGNVQIRKLKIFHSSHICHRDKSFHTISVGPDETLNLSTLPSVADPPSCSSGKRRWWCAGSERQGGSRPGGWTLGGNRGDPRLPAPPPGSASQFLPD